MVNKINKFFWIGILLLLVGGILFEGESNVGIILMLVGFVSVITFFVKDKTQPKKERKR